MYEKLSPWRHFNTTTKIQFVFLFLFKLCILSEIKITIALISMRQANLEDSGTCSQMASSYYFGDLFVSVATVGELFRGSKAYSESS